MCAKSPTYSSFPSIPCIFLSFTLLSIFSLSFFFVANYPKPTCKLAELNSSPQSSIKVFVADLPRSFNYDLLNQYWASTSPDARLPFDPDHQIHHERLKFPPFPENPLIKQYSAEYWILGDLESPENVRGDSFAKRVFRVEEADVVFVPFFATLSAEMELGKERSSFRKKSEENEDYKRQKEVVEIVKKSEAWRRSGGRDHVFVLTGRLSSGKVMGLVD